MRIRSLSAACVLAVLLLSGCAREVTDSPSSDKLAANGKGKHQHVHGDWWCAEHGVPEEICARCKPELVAEFKRKKDWCDKHDRPSSQCFLCEPELFKRYAVQYEARYNKKPPKPTE